MVIEFFKINKIALNNNNGQHSNFHRQMKQALTITLNAYFKLMFKHFICFFFTYYCHFLFSLINNLKFFFVKYYIILIISFFVILEPGNRTNSTASFFW